MLDNIEWLFFDLGGTLIDESEQEKVIVTLASEESGKPHNEIYNTMIEMSIAYKNPVRDALKKLTGTDELFLRIKETGRYYPTELERLFPKVKKTLKTLSVHYKLGIIGNQKPNLEQRMKDYGIHEYFNVFAGSGDINISKPDPAIFLYALDKARCKEKQAVMIGDRLDNDIHPAKKLGFTTIWVKQGIGGYQKAKNKDFEADYIVDKIADVVELL